MSVSKRKNEILYTNNYTKDVFLRFLQVILVISFSLVVIRIFNVLDDQEYDLLASGFFISMSQVFIIFVNLAILLIFLSTLIFGKTNLIYDMQSEVIVLNKRFKKEVIIRIRDVSDLRFKKYDSSYYTSFKVLIIGDGNKITIESGNKTEMETLAQKLSSKIDRKKG